MKIIDLKFVGIDDWNRPVFYSEVSKAYFGSVEKLFEYGDKEETVLSKVTPDDICYFGRSFDCEPHGGVPKDVSFRFITKEAINEKV